MIDLSSHKKWIGLLALAALIGTSNKSLLGIALNKAEQKLAKLHQQKERALADLRQLEDDIKNIEGMKTEIDASEAKKTLAPVDRLRAAQILEQRAAEGYLSNLSYSFSPEEKAVFDTIGAGRQELARSKWTLKAEAPSDTDAYEFLEALSRTLPGRVTVNHLLLERVERPEISNTNLHFSASGEWLSNGASPNPAEKQP